MTPQEIKSLFHLRDDITFLNFGSYGACPKSVMEEYQQLQIEMEQEPVDFISRRGRKYLDKSKQALSEYIHCDQEDIIFITNPSYGLNLVAKNFKLEKGDEILTTNIEYGASDKTWEYYTEKSGAKYIRQQIEFPVVSKEHFLEQFWKGLSTKTKLIFISHITSSTGIRLPVEDVCEKANAMGIPCFVDGAHAPGQIEIDIKKLNPMFYTGACHKWMMTPKGCSFIYVKKEMQPRLDPLAISWGYKSLFPSTSIFQDYHQMNGTRDFTAFLTIPAVLNFMKICDWDTVKRTCREIVQSNALKFCELLETKPITPVNDDFICQMYSAELNSNFHQNNLEKFHDLLFDEFKIQIPIIRQDDKVYIRYSINGFNSQDDLDRLMEVMKTLKSLN